MVPTKAIFISTDFKINRFHDARNLGFHRYLIFWLDFSNGQPLSIIEPLSTLNVLSSPSFLAEPSMAKNNTNPTIKTSDTASIIFFNIAPSPQKWISEFISPN